MAASNQVNVNLVRSIVEHVVREGGTTEEIKTKVTFLIREMKQKVLSMEEEIAPTSPAISKFDFVPHNIRDILKRHEESEITLLQKENNKLKAENSHLTLRLKKADEKYAALRKEVDTTNMSKSVDVYTFSEFKKLVIEKHFFGRNKEQGWQQLFIDCNRQGYKQSHLNKWKSDDIVPLEAVAAIDNLDLSKKVGEKMQPWTQEEIQAFEHYVIEVNGAYKLTKSHAEIANDLSIRFGRNLNENSIKSKMNTYKQNKKKAFKSQEIS